jgi:SSS family solute:Na+ symporter
VIGALRVFYSVLGVSMFVPVLGGLFVRRAGAPEALAAIAAGVLTLALIGLGGRPYPWVDPTLTGLVASAAAFLGVLAVRRPRRSRATKTTTLGHKEHKDSSL